MNCIREGIGLYYSYGSSEVLSNLSIKVPQGVTGLVGPNGAGKTSLLKLLAGINKPKAGKVINSDVVVASTLSRSKLREDTGFLPQNPTWTASTTIWDFVSYCFRMQGRKTDLYSNITNALKQTNTFHLKDRKIGKVSGGEQRRVFLAGAIVHNPKVIILDEPTVGLDPEQRIEFKKLISALSKEHAILLSTHIIEDLRDLANNIIVINYGKEVWSGNPEDLTKQGEKIAGISDLEAGYLNVLGR